QNTKQMYVGVRSVDQRARDDATLAKNSKSARICCPLFPSVICFDTFVEPRALVGAVFSADFATDELSSTVGMAAISCPRFSGTHMAQSNDDFRTKYRPRRYDQMWQGLEYPAIKRLRREEELIRYPRGLIFCGDYGCGKTTAARIRGMRASCWNYKQHTVEPCGNCPGCRGAMSKQQGPDYFEMDGTSERLRSNIDYALRKTAVAKVHSHPLIPRVFFVDEAHRANAKTQETLLKDIEDHQQAIFILSTTQPDKL